MLLGAGMGATLRTLYWTASYSEIDGSAELAGLGPSKIIQEISVTASENPNRNTLGSGETLLSSRRLLATKRR